MFLGILDGKEYIFVNVVDIEFTQLWPIEDLFAKNDSDALGIYVDFIREFYS